MRDTIWIWHVLARAVWRALRQRSSLEVALDGVLCDMERDAAALVVAIREARAEREARA